MIIIWDIQINKIKVKFEFQIPLPKLNSIHFLAKRNESLPTPQGSVIQKNEESEHRIHYKRPASNTNRGHSEIFNSSIFRPDDEYQQKFLDCQVSCKTSRKRIVKHFKWQFIRSDRFLFWRTF